MSQAKFPFGKDFQIKILSHMFYDFDFLIFAQELVNPNFFSDKVLAWFFTTMRDYFMDFQMRMDEAILRNELKKAATAKRIKAQEVQAYFQTYKAVVEKSDGKEYVTKELISFCRHQAIKSAALEVPDLLAKNDFDAVEELWGKAFTVGIAGVDLGHQYFVAWPERLGTRAIKLEEMIFPTGITALDVILGGGIRVKQLGLWMAPTNRGKCHKIGTEVIKYDGSFVKVEDVKSGDFLMGPDGSPRKVLGTTRGRGSLYRIVPNRGGESFECNLDHMLTLYDHQSHSVIDVPLDTYLGWSKDRRRLSRLVRSSGVAFPPTNDPVVDPWFLGVWYADGTKNLNTVSVTNPDQEIVDSLIEYAAAEGLSATVRATSASNPCPFISLIGEGYGRPNHLLDKIRSIYGDGSRLPANYLRGSAETRKAFLAGLIDGDGYCGGSGRIDLIQKHKQWAEDIAYLARSLGYMVSIRKKKVRLSGWKEHRTYWRLTIVGDTSNLPLRLERKNCRPKKQWNHVGFRVELVEPGEYAGFELDGDSRYLLRDFTVTHNSVALVHCGKRAVIMRKKVIHYTLELSADDVAERYDASFTKIPVRDLVDREADLARKLENLGHRMGNSLIIKEYPTKSASVNTLQSHVMQCVASGFVPDMIIVDYLDLLRPSHRRKEKREELTDISEALRGLAGELVIPCWSATQSRRSAISKEVHDEEDVAEDIGKMNISDIVITINQTKEQHETGEMKLLVAKNRNGPRWETVDITTNLHRMCFFNPPKGMGGPPSNPPPKKGLKSPPPAKPAVKKSPPPAKPAIKKSPPIKKPAVVKKSPPMRRPQI